MIFEYNGITKTHRTHPITGQLLLDCQNIENLDSFPHEGFQTTMRAPNIRKESPP
jgi:hypothetical protein